MLLQLDTSFDPAKKAGKLTDKDGLQTLYFVDPQVKLMTTRTLIKMSLQAFSSVEGNRAVVAVFLSILFGRGTL